MTTLSTITELLLTSNCQFRIYDLGRKIEKLSKETFEKIEQCSLVHPFPFQEHAHFAIAFWQKKSKQPYLWFIKLPLDERGLLNQGARNHFLAIIVEALGSDLSVEPSERQEELLKENPYIFTPSQYKLAMLNSLLSFELKRAPSQFYQTFINYLTKEEWSQWHNIGVQGITDYAARLTEDNNAVVLSQSISKLPFEVLSPLCGALENISLPVCLIESIQSQLQTSSNDIQSQQMLLRSLASSTKHPFVKQYFESIFTADIIPVDIAITIAGRCWQIIVDEKQAMYYLELLVKLDKELFPAIFKDLVAIPTIRPLLFQCMRAADRSDELAKAIGQLFNKQG